MVTDRDTHSLFPSFSTMQLFHLCDANDSKKSVSTDFTVKRVFLSRHKAGHNLVIRQISSATVQLQRWKL